MKDEIVADKEQSTSGKAWLYVHFFNNKKIPPSSLAAKGTFSLKIARNEFWQKIILHNIAGVKEPYFLPNIATDLSKNNDFASSVHLSIDMSSYYKTLCFIYDWEQNFKKKVSKRTSFFAATLLLS